MPRGLGGINGINGIKVLKALKAKAPWALGGDFVVQCPGNLPPCTPEVKEES
jgi:hypothetical protein